MNRLSRISAVFMMLLLVLTAQSAAVARTMPDATGKMVLCTGSGPVMVYMDAEGNPTGAPHICPDCALSLIVANPEPDLILTPLGVWTTASVPAPILMEAAQIIPVARARAPPLTI